MNKTNITQPTTTAGASDQPGSVQPAGSAEYRYLQDGEILQATDQVWTAMRNEWRPTVNVGVAVGTASTSLPYRRPLSPNSVVGTNPPTKGKLT